MEKHTPAKPPIQPNRPNKIDRVEVFEAKAPNHATEPVVDPIAKLERLRAFGARIKQGRLH
jgi:hypothetical protein